MIVDLVDPGPFVPVAELGAHLSLASGHLYAGHEIGVPKGWHFTAAYRHPTGRTLWRIEPDRPLTEAPAS